jgi:hypothetical protein
MKVRDVIQEYFTEPFVCLGLVLLITSILSNYVSLVNDFEGYLFVKFFYYVYFFGTFFLYSMLISEPLKAIKQYENPKKIKFGSLYIITIFLILLLSVMPSQFDPYMFFSDKLHAIKDPKVVLEMKAYVYTVGLMGSPILGIITKRLIKKQLLKDKIEMPEINYGMAFVTSWLFFISLLSTFVVFDALHICFAKGFCP